MNLEQARTNMVEQQIRTWEVLDQDVLDLLYAVPREEFVAPAWRNLAFTDMEIPLRAAGNTAAASGQRMWAPKLEARVLQALAPRRSDRVLEVGTGSGYLTALLAHRAAQVYSVEIDPELAALGRANVVRHGVDNVTLAVGDGARGYPKWGPYDVIVFTGSLPVLPAALAEALAPGGRAFAVLGDGPAMTAKLVTRGAADALQSTELFEILLSPLANCERPSRFAF